MALRKKRRKDMMDVSMKEKIDGSKKNGWTDLRKDG